MASLAVPGILIGHRVIQPGDETALLETEIKTITSPAPEKRRASGAARIVGRALLKQLGVPEGAIPKRVSGAPLWPDGVTGSFAHDQLVAVAAAGLRKNVGAVGIDIEPATMLPDDMFDLVTTPTERSRDRRAIRIAAGFSLRRRKRFTKPCIRSTDSFSIITISRSISAAQQGRDENRTHARYPVLYCRTHIVVVAWLSPIRCLKRR